MLLPQIKEREYRFRLALRMVLPISALVIALIIHTFISSSENLNNSFFIESILVLVFSIYFIFYLIYKGFETKITDNVSKVFSKEYLYNYLEKEIKNSKEYTLLLISIDNLNEINSRYGIENGDKILFEVVIWIEKYFEEKNIDNFPIGYIKDGDFIIGLKGAKSNYKVILDLICLKSQELKINDIEVQISGAINDITFSKEIKYLIENLFELLNKNKNSKLLTIFEEDIDPNELESLIINAISKKDLSIMSQNVFDENSTFAKEYFVKLRISDNKLLHPKSYMKVLDKLRIMVDYDLIVLEKILAISKNSKDMKIAVSVAPTSIRNPLFISRVKELVAGDNFSKIVFILSESEYYPRIDRYNSILQTLRNIGISIVIDRLGSLNTSFLYLRDLDIDIVRFDSFYTKEVNQTKYKNIIDGFNIMAHNKGVKSWVKMIENESVHKSLREQNIDYFQGKYLASLEKI